MIESSFRLIMMELFVIPLWWNFSPSFYSWLKSDRKVDLSLNIWEIVLEMYTFCIVIHCAGFAPHKRGVHIPRRPNNSNYILFWFIDYNPKILTLKKRNAPLVLIFGAYVTIYTWAWCISVDNQYNHIYKVFGYWDTWVVVILYF